MAEQQQDATTQTKPASSTTAITQAASSTPNGAAEIPKWANQLPPDLRQPSILRHKEFAGLAKDYLDLEKVSLRVPGTDAPQEERDAFYAKLGRPDSPDKYDIKFPEGTSVDDNLLGAFRGVAHRLGLSQSQAQSLSEWWAGQSGAMSEAQNGKTEAEKAEWDKQLTTDWGWQKERNTALAARAFNMAVDGADFAQPLAKLLDDTGLGNHPLLIKFFHHMAVKNGEDKLVTADTGPTADDRTTAKEQINAIRGDKAHPYNNPKHPGYKDAVRHMNALYETLYAKEE